MIRLMSWKLEGLDSHTYADYVSSPDGYVSQTSLNLYARFGGGGGVMMECNCANLGVRT
jgi:hypothetical protein